MPYVWSSLAKSVSGSACAGAANTRAGATAAAAMEASLIPFITYLCNRTGWVFVIGTSCADADRGLGGMPRWFRPRHRLRTRPDVLRPPEPAALHRRDRRRHERADHQRVEEQAETDRGAHLPSDHEVADHHRHHGEREHQTGRGHYCAGTRHRPDDACLDAGVDLLFE